MSQAAAIVINDGQATPVATTFNPESISPDQSVFSDRTSGISVTFRKLKAGVKFPSGAGKVTKSTYEVEVPIGTTVNGVTSVAYTLRARLDIYLPDGCTDAQRKDLYAFVQNGLSNPLIRGTLRDLDPLY